jgi:uncharacterized circularly permuted ATP-grasp superfamily protein/uncharacterized alpha-E superfamily protein
MPSSLFVNYPHTQQRYDELLDHEGSVRAHWQGLLTHLQHSGSAAMAQRVSTINRTVRENGVTYNVYADPQGSDRPWAVDAIPMILPADEWAHIESAVIQRAGLLNRILQDIYGPQHMLAQGHLPAALVHGHAGFLRPCHGLPHLGGVSLHMYAVDLARSPDGRWWVVADRTQAPSGAGYALENRMIVARSFPEQFRDLNVQRLAGFFTNLRDSLTHWGHLCKAHQDQKLAPHERPMVVLLTPGPYNETYYEQAYLARYLGFPLVQGSDLTVRDGFVWLKTLSGLQRVHVIVRRLDDDYCDPLELRKESALGVAGLTEAVRQGTVLVANGLGSNLLESGALLGFLPNLCEQMLGQPLQMPSIATWWCGEPAALDDAIARIDHLVFKPAFPQLRQAPVFGQDLSPAAKAQFIAKLRATPHNHVAQELIHFSQAPVWHDASGLRAASMSLRVFACATPEGYIVMPGGLTRVATGPDARVVSMQRGGASKDTWVLTQGMVDKRSLLPRNTLAQDLIRGETRLASRTVENLFWFGRYGERCSNTARLMRRCFDSLIDTDPDKRGHVWPVLLRLCDLTGLIAEDVPQTPKHVQQQLLQALVESDAYGLANQAQQLFRIGFNLRERLSTDNWRALNQISQRFGQANAQDKLSIGAAIVLLDESMVSLAALSGFALDGMTRDMGWRFLSTGRCIERLQYLSTVIGQALHMPYDGNKDWLLELGDSLVTYRSRYMARPEWMPVLDLLLLDASNPHGMVFQLDWLISNLQKITQAHGSCGLELIEPLLRRLQATNVSTGLRPGHPELMQLMDDVTTQTARLADQLTSQFFSYASHASAMTREQTPMQFACKPHVF